MLNFVDINKELSFKSKFGVPDFTFGLQLAFKNKPLDFQYLSTESVTSFQAVKVDNIGNTLETITLSTSLIVSDGTTHKCDGLTDYSTNLDCGIYYFNVNGHYLSDYFQIFSELNEGALGDIPITISGLNFVDTTIDRYWNEKKGHVDNEFALQYSDNKYPLPFEYLAPDAISSFVAVNIDTLEEVTLSTSLVVSDGTTHKCDGLTSFNIDCGIWYLKVNNRYKSELFGIIQLIADYALLLETGDYLLLETGDKLLLE